MTAEAKIYPDETGREAGLSLPAEMAVPTIEKTRQRMARQKVPVTENGQEFFSWIQGVEGEVRVDEPTPFDTYFDYAHKVTDREQTAKQSLQGRPVQEQIAGGREVMAKNTAAFAEARSVQEILDQLLGQGQLLMVSRNIGGKDLPPDSLRYILPSAEVLKQVQETCASLGYSIKKVGNALVVQGDSTKLVFFASQREVEKLAVQAEEYDSDYYDDEESRESDLGVTTGDGKNKKLSKGLAKGTASGSVSGSADKIGITAPSRGAVRTKKGKPVNILGEEDIGLPIIPTPSSSPTSMPFTRPDLIPNQNTNGPDVGFDSSNFTPTQPVAPTAPIGHAAPAAGAGISGSGAGGGAGGAAAGGGAGG